MGDRNEIYIVQWEGEDIAVPYSADRLLSMICRNPSVIQQMGSVTKSVRGDETRHWEMGKDQ